MYRLIAINISDKIDIKKAQTIFGRSLISTSSELFLKTVEEKFITIFNNGVVTFANYDSNEINTTLDSLKPFLTNPQENINETININFTQESRAHYEEGTLFVPEEFNSNNLMRIVMYDLSQTVGIDYYSKTAENLLSEVEKFASELESTGKMRISEKEMNKFIGKSLSTKNKIVGNLYLFDVPDLAWEDERLDVVHKILSRTFDISARIKELQSTLEVVDDNLNIFKDMYQHTHSAFLEIVVIVLILIEILQTANIYKWF